MHSQSLRRAAIILTHEQQALEKGAIGSSVSGDIGFLLQLFVP